MAFFVSAELAEEERTAGLDIAAGLELAELVWAFPLQETRSAARRSALPTRTKDFFIRIKPFLFEYPQFIREGGDSQKRTRYCFSLSSGIGAEFPALSR
jgi:hypothetical protein